MISNKETIIACQDKKPSAFWRNTADHAHRLEIDGQTVVVTVGKRQLIIKSYCKFFFSNNEILNYRHFQLTATTASWYRRDIHIPPPPTPIFFNAKNQSLVENAQQSIKERILLFEDRNLTVKASKPQSKENYKNGKQMEQEGHLRL